MILVDNIWYPNPYRIHRHQNTSTTTIYSRMLHLYRQLFLYRLLPLCQAVRPGLWVLTLKHQHQ